MGEVRGGGGMRVQGFQRAAEVGLVTLAVTLGGCRDDRSGGSADEGDAGDDGGTAGATESDTGEPADGGDEPAPQYLSPREHLVRVSMALRGTRPSADELAAVEADPAALEGIVDGYLESPNFGETMRDLHNESLLVLADYFIFPAGFVDLPPLEGTDPYVLNRSVMESSLRLVEHVIMSDRPYSEIVTADYTLANGVVAAIFGLTYEGDGASWETTEWTDGRGNAGILSDGWLYQRHSSTVSNANRGRANAISRALLCYDFAARDVELDASINLADPDEVADAVVENAACASCHQALDPLASFFRSNFPLYVPGDPMSVPSYPHATYVPDIFPTYLGVQMRDPSYFGTPGDGMPMLGTMIAGDPRFWSCTVRRFYGYFHQTAHETVPLETVAEYQDVFLESGFDAKALVKSIVLSDEFRISHWEEEVQDDRFGVKKARPLQLQQLVRDTTGFQWITNMSEFGLGNVDLMADSFLGYQVLAGGIDAMFVTRPSHTFGATTSLVQQSLAREAAHHVVETDFAQAAGDRRLLSRVEPSDTSESTVKDQLALLHARIFAEPDDPDSEAVAESWALWSAAHEASGDPMRAWKTVLTAMLQDVKVASY
jgi:hypothetical protein